jgi:hypothetical protein
MINISLPYNLKAERRQLLAFQLFYLQVKDSLKELEKKLESLKNLENNEKDS